MFEFTSLSTLTWYDDTTCVGSSEVAIAANLNSSISTALMRPRRPKQYCLQLYIYLTDFTKTYLYKIQDSFQLCSSKASANQ